MAEKAKNEPIFPKVTKEELKKLQGIISARTQTEKDLLLASLYISTERMGEMIKFLMAKREGPLTKKEEREIEDSISLGPSWLNYSKKVKRKKQA